MENQIFIVNGKSKEKALLAGDTCYKQTLRDIGRNRYGSALFHVYTSLTFYQDIDLEERMDDANKIVPSIVEPILIKELVPLKLFIGREIPQAIISSLIQIISPSYQGYIKTKDECIDIWAGISENPDKYLQEADWLFEDMVMAPFMVGLRAEYLFQKADEILDNQRSLDDINVDLGVCFKALESLDYEAYPPEEQEIIDILKQRLELISEYKDRDIINNI